MPATRPRILEKTAVPEWQAPDAEGREQAVPVLYRRQRQAEPEAYVVAWHLHRGGALPVAKLVQGHRSEQGQGNARNGPLAYSAQKKSAVRIDG